MPNQLLDLYRKQTEDPRPDDELILEWAETMPEALNLPDFKADYDRVAAAEAARRAQAAEVLKPSAGDYVRQAVRSGVSGAAGMVASLPESIAVNAAALARATGTDDQPGEGDPGNPEDRFTYQLGQWIRGVADRIAPAEVPELRESFWATKVPAGLGSATGFLAGGAAGKLMKVPAWVGIAGLGSAATGNEFYHDAKANGADEKTAYLSSLVGNIVGTSEAFPLARMLNRLDGVSGNSFTRTLIQAGKETFEEALQEAAQQFAKNYTARELYDKDRDLFKDLKENASVGGVTGFLFSLVTEGVGRRMGLKDLSGVPKVDGPANEPPSVAGQPNAPAGPATSPVLPVVAGDYVRKNDGTELTEAERSQLGALARQELETGSLPIEAKSVIEREAAYANAYALIKEQVKTQVAVEAAAAETDPNPTEAQKEAGNYRKGKVDVDGMEVSIENPIGSERSGRDADGKPWSVTMPANYGYILGTVGKDKDHLDIYLGPDLAAPQVVVVNQADPKTGKFDEHKTLYGFPSEAAALQAYDAAFSDGSGPSRRQSVAVLTKEEFQRWIKEGDHKKPVQSAPATITGSKVQQGTEMPAEAGATTVGRSIPVPEPAPYPTPLEGQPYEIDEPVAALAQTPTAPPQVQTPPAETRTAPAEVSTVDVAKWLDDVNVDRPEGGLAGRVIKDAMFFDVPEEGFSERLAERLTYDTKAQGKGLKKGSVNRSFTHRYTYFLDTQTGQVVGLPTTIVDKARVGPLPGGKLGTSLEGFLKSGRYKVIGSQVTGAPVRYSDPGAARVFPSRAAYEVFASGARAKQAVEAARQAEAKKKAASAEESLTSQAVGVEYAEEDGQRVRVYSEPVNLDREFFETITDFLPVKNRKIRTDLKLEDIQEALVAALSDVESGPAIRHGFENYIRWKIESNPEFELTVEKTPLENQQAQRNLLREISDKLYASYLASVQNENFSPEEFEKNAQASLEAAPESAGGGAAVVRPGGADLQIGSGEATTAGSGGVAGANAGATGGGTEGAATGGTGGQIGEPTTATGVGGQPGLQLQPAAGATVQGDVRFHSGAFEAPYRAEGWQVAAAFQSTISALANAGLTVSLVPSEAAGMAAEFGQFDNARQAVTLAMANVATPSVENLYHLNAEVAHAVYAGLTAAEAEQLQAAVKSATDEMLGINRPFEIAASVPMGLRESVQQEERLVDVVARNLTAKGFDAAKATGLAQSFWRVLRSLINRAALALARAWGVAPQVQARLAAEYLQVRVEQFLAGNIRPWSFVDFMGGGRRQPQVVNEWFEHATGYSALNFRWNPDLGVIEVQEADPFSVAAILHNADNPTIRYHGPVSRNAEAQVSVDLGSEVALADVAANNVIGDALHDQFVAWDLAGNNTGSRGQPPLTEKEFREMVLKRVNGVDDPALNIQAINQRLAHLKKAPIDPSTKMDSLNEAGQKETAAKAYGFFHRLRAAWQKRYRDSAYETSLEPGSAARRHSRIALRVATLLTKYTETDTLFSEMKADLDGWLRWLRLDLNNIKNLAHRNGVLAQAIGAVEGRFDEGLGRQYAEVINRLVNRFANSADSRTDFVALLTRVAEANIDWGHSDLATIKDLLQRGYGETEAKEFEVFRQDSPESRALLAITAAFAKRNALLMHTLSLRREARTNELVNERAQLNDILQAALKFDRAAIENARRLAAKLPNLKSKADFILNELERTQESQRVLQEEIEEHRRWMAFHEGATRLLTEQMAKVEEKLSIAEEVFEPFPGARMLVVENANERPESILARPRAEFSPHRTGGADAKLKEQLALKQAWLAAHPEGDPLHRGDVYNRLAIEIAKLGENEMQAEVDKGSRSLIATMIGSVTKRLEATGHPAGKALARMYREWGALHYRYREDPVEVASRWSKKANRAARLLGLGGAKMERFYELYYNAPMAYVDRRMDLTLAGPTDAAALDRKIAAMKAHVGLLEKKQLEALEDFWRESWRASDWEFQAFRQAGLQVKDEENGVYRDGRGARGEIRRSFNGTIDRVYHEEMVGRPGAGNAGPWAGNPLKDRPVALEYQEDVAKLRSDLAPLFGPEVWRWFVGELANRGGRAAFMAAPDGSGLSRLASVEECRQAFRAAAPGDVVGFAENLFALSGGRDARALPEFVAETVGTIRAYFEWLHHVKQQQANRSGATVQAVQHLMMDARLTDEAPDGWMRYERFDLHSVKSRMSQMAFHAAFGRDLKPAEALWRELGSHFKAERDKLQRHVLDRNPRNREETKSLARAAGLDLEQLELASGQLAMLKHEHDAFVNWVKSHGGVAMEFQAWNELLSFMVSMVVQGPKTAFIDTSTMFKPIQIFGAGKVGLGYTARNIRNTAGVVARGFLEMFGLQVKNQSDHDARVFRFGQQPAADRVALHDRVVTAALGYPVSESNNVSAMIRRGISVRSRQAREIVGTPVRLPFSVKEATVPRVKPALFTYLGQALNFALAKSTWQTFDNLVMDAAQWFETGGVMQRQDANFTFTKAHAKQLGYNEREFSVLLAMLNQNGQTLERLAKDWLARGKSSAVMSDEVYQRLLTVGPTELMQESSMITRPSWMLDNPLIRLGAPLVGWSVTQTASLEGPARKPITGERENLPAVIKNLTLSFAPLIGVGLAYALMADWYDEYVLRKKSNRLSLSSDNLALALVDRLNVSGLGGMAGDVVNSFVNTQTGRDVSIDSRVFFVNSMTGIFRAVRAWANQGEATYATVGRPLTMALGGSGALQYLQAFNGVLGLDNFESRATARINAGNWLRVAGRGINLEVRSGRGGNFETTANAVTPWVREMVLAALANDSADFSDAYRSAVLAAREEKMEDPHDYVKRAFQRQHPLRSVFNSVVGEREYRKLLQSLPDNGRRDVMEAVNLMNRYGQRLGLEPFTGQKRGLNPLDARSLMRREAVALSGRSLLGF